MEGVSLGWRCESALLGTQLGLREVKQNGYATCPFDIAVTNYLGVCKCIEDDFKYFCDPNYLVLKYGPKMKKHLGDNQKDDEFFIYNTYYNFAFNHESPGHGNLYQGEGWSGGINHFVNNNFEKFIERYNKRINNFRNYINSGKHINFLLHRFNSVPTELEEVIARKYTKLSFTIYCWTGFSNSTIDMTRNKNIEAARDFELEYLDYMNTDREKNPAEYLRYFMIDKPLVNKSDRIKLINH